MGESYHFENTDVESDHRVRLVPKTADATIEPNTGEDLEMVDLGDDGYGFCLSKRAGISCENAQPNTRVFQLTRIDGGTIQPNGATMWVDGALVEGDTPPTWLVVKNRNATPEEWTQLGLIPNELYSINVIELETKSSLPHRFELLFSPTNQDAVSFRTFDPNVLIEESTFGVCLKGLPPEPVCDWARMGLLIAPDLFYGDALTPEGTPVDGGVYDVTWEVEINGILLPRIIDPSPMNNLETVLDAIPGIISGYVGIKGDLSNPSGTYAVNDTVEAIKIRLIPNKQFPVSRLLFGDITNQGVLDNLLETPPNFGSLNQVQHGSVFIADDCSINICLAPKGATPAGISCDGASPYLIMVVALNPNATIPASGLSIVVDNGEAGFSLPPEIFESVDISLTGLTPEQVLSFAKEVRNLPDDHQMMIGGVFLNKTDQNHIVRTHIQPENQDSHKFIFFSPWGNELYSDGGMGVCVGAGSNVPQPKPYQCGSGTNAVFVKTTSMAATELSLIEYGNSIASGTTLEAFVDSINLNTIYLQAVVVGNQGFIIRNLKEMDNRTLQLVSGIGLPVVNDYQFFDINSPEDFDKLSGEGYQELIDSLTEPSLNTFFDDVDKSIKFCLKRFVVDNWWLTELKDSATTEIITELDANYLDLHLDWFFPQGGLPAGYDLNVQISNQAICTFNGSWEPGLVRFSIHQIVGSTDVTITHPQRPDLPPITFKITKVAPKNKVRTFSLEQNNHILLDGDNNPIGVDQTFNFIGGVAGKYVYLSFTVVYENSSNREADPEILLCTVANPAVASTTLLNIRDVPDLWDQSAGEYRKCQRGLIRIDFNQVGNTNISIVPKRATFTAVTPIVYNVTAIAPTGDMVLQVHTQQNKVCTIEVIGGNGIINWGDGSADEYDVGQSVFTHTFATLGVKQEVTITANTSIDYLRADGFDNIIKWPDVSIKQLRLPSVMNVPVELPTGIETLANTFRDNVYFNSVIEEYNTLGILDFSYFASGAISFDQNVGNWNTTSATTFTHAFENTSLTCTLHNDFSNVVDVSYMLKNAKKWGGGISTRNFHKVTNMDFFVTDILYQRKAVGSNGGGTILSPIPSFAHLELPLISVRPIDFRFTNEIGNGGADDGPTDPVWGKIHVYNSETTYTQDTTRIDTNEQITAMMTRYQGDDTYFNDVIVMEDAQGRVIDSIRGIDLQGVGPRYLTNPKPKVETTYKVKSSGIIVFDSFQYPLSTRKVLDWSNFKTAGIRGLGAVESVPNSIPVWFKDFRDTFSIQFNSINQSLHYNGTDVLTWNMEQAVDVSYMFQGNLLFNQPINWKLPLVPATGFNYMFHYATSFNQDLTGWCTSVNNPSAIQGFANNSAMQAENYPVWGTCPAPHNT